MRVLIESSVTVFLADEIGGFGPRVESARSYLIPILAVVPILAWSATILNPNLLVFITPVLTGRDNPIIHKLPIDIDSHA